MIHLDSVMMRRMRLLIYLSLTALFSCVATSEIGLNSVTWRVASLTNRIAILIWLEMYWWYLIRMNTYSMLRNGTMFRLFSFLQRRISMWLFFFFQYRYRCTDCKSAEELLYSIHKLYYSSPSLNRTKILFAIARIETTPNLFLKVFVLTFAHLQSQAMIVPYIYAHMPPSPTNKNGEMYTSEKTTPLTISSMTQWFKETLPLDVLLC